MKNIKKYIPNLVTITRIISCICGATLFILGNIPLAIASYVYGAVSDAFDGFLARKLNAVSETGKKLDAVSDKIFALSLLIPSIILGNYLMMLPLILESAISTINIYSNNKYHKTHTEKIGKFKTIVLFPTMILGLAIVEVTNLVTAFIPLLIASVTLQIGSILAYNEQLKRYRKEDKEIKNNTVNNYNELDKSISNKKEYTNTFNNKIVNNKVKKLIRKKDYNDRH